MNWNDQELEDDTPRRRTLDNETPDRFETLSDTRSLLNLLTGPTSSAVRKLDADLVRRRATRTSELYALLGKSSVNHGIEVLIQFNTALFWFYSDDDGEVGSRLMSTAFEDTGGSIFVQSSVVRR